MRKNVSLIALLVAALALFAAWIYLSRPARNNFTRVTVMGESQTRVAPDTAVIMFSVVTENSQVVAAQQENARKSEAVKTAVEAVVVAGTKTEVKTSNYNLQPEQDYSGRTPKIVGYEVRNTVTVSVSDLKQVGAVIDAATRAGANSVEGIAFVVREDSPAQGGALMLATRQALTKAEAIADSLGGRVARVVESREGGVQPFASAPEYSAMTANSNAATTARRSYSTPVQTGSLDVYSQIVLAVEIEIRH